MFRYLVFVLAGLPSILTAISATSVAVAFPLITSSFGVSLILAGWVLSIYQLVATAAMPLAGKASDVLGRKATFLLCLFLFALGSFLCAVAPNIYLLIFGRTVQAIGGGGFMPCATGIVADLFPDKRQQAIGLFSSMHPLGQIVGPTIGGWLITSFGWHSVFWLNVPLAIIIIIIAAFVLHPEPRRETRIDLMGSALFTGSIFTFMIGLSTLGTTSTGMAWFLVPILLVASVVFMASFVRRAGRVPNPVIDPVVLQKKPFMAANVYNLLLGICYFGMSSLIPLYAVSVYGLSTLASGLILTPKAIAVMAASTLVSLYMVKWGYRRPMLFGSASIIFTLVLLGLEIPGISLLGLQLSGAALIPAIMIFAGIGIGTVSPAANNACIELMPQRVATISGIRGMFRQTGAAISIAAGTLLLSNATDMAQGFRFFFFFLATVMALAVPLIFLMPKSCREVPIGGMNEH